MKRFSKKETDIKTDTVEEFKEEQKVESPTSNNNNEKEFKKKMMLIGGIILGGFIILLLILLIISLFSKKNYSYEEVESVLKNAAIEYYADHRTYLPVSDNQIIDIDDTTLSNGEYMKVLSEYVNEQDSCTGKVEVKKNGDKYLYTPYLDCGKSYLTTQLYKKIMDSTDIVTEGYGLYNLNNEYVYRGEKLKNYVLLNEHYWRIVKINSNNQVVLVMDEKVTSTTSWDDRYNEVKKYNSGINTYNLSRLKERLIELYDSKPDDYYTLFLTEEIKEHLDNHNVCIGSRAESNNTKDNSVECNNIVENQKVSLLTVSDYLNASTDQNCTTTISQSCQNYNYLRTDYNWWLTTVDSETNFYVYKVLSEGYIDKVYASNSAYIRPVIYLDTATMYKSGTGSYKNPFIIR